MVTLTVHVPDPTGEELRRQAHAAGKPVEQFVSDLLEAQTASSELLRAISGAAYKRFLATGMTENQLGEQLEREDHAARGVPYDA